MKEAYAAYSSSLRGRGPGLNLDGIFVFVYNHDKRFDEKASAQALSRGIGPESRALAGFNLSSIFLRILVPEGGDKMRVLLAEDEKRMAAALTALLRQEKYDVDPVADGAAALTALESGVYDIAVLDVMMPELNGFEVVRRARGKGIGTPILMLTAKSQLDDKVEGLDSGADDYLTKPFQTKELLARLRAL